MKRCKFIERPVGGSTNEDDDGMVLVRPKTNVEPKVEQPKMWALLFHNDDFTPIEFVVEVMCEHLKVDVPTALQCAIVVHQRGCGRFGRFPRDIAETKAKEIMDSAKAQQHPLRVDPTSAD